MSASFEVGGRVLLTGRAAGTVRFFGDVGFADGKWVGVELDKPGTGRNDGSVDGTRYFDLEAHADADPAEAAASAVFVRPEAVRDYDPQVQAANIIGGMARSRKAKKEVRRALTARTWNKLDANEEDRHIKRGKHVRDAITGVLKEMGETTWESKSGGGGDGASAQRMRRSSLMNDADVGDLRSIVVEPGYDGVRLHFPLKRSEVLAMLEMFKRGQPLHYRYVAQLLVHFKKTASKSPTVQKLTIEEGQKFTVVGDLHGQLQDLFTIFTINGLPTAQNRYLFNGDFVDRGSMGCEVFLTLVAFHFLCPESVYFNRGNHEARAQTSWMGFEEEVLGKYGSFADSGAARRLYNRYLTCFDMLPLVAVVQEKVFVCHGGLFRMDGVTLKHIEAIRRRREPPLEGTSLEDKIFEDLIWSDPRPTGTYPGRLVGRRPSDRGAGVEFGPDVTNQFCITNSIALVLRSHECVQEGYEVLHDGRLITIFSASRYCGTQTNKGAFITFGPDLQPEIQQFYAHAMESVVLQPKADAEEEREKQLEEDAVRMIIERVCDKKADLYWYFTQHDDRATGECSRLQWAEALKTVLDLNLPFLHMQDKLCDLEASGLVNYARFLERYRIQMRAEDQGWMGGIIQRVCQKLFKMCGTIEEAFRVFDVNDDGSIEYSEFVQTLRDLDVGLTDDQIYELMRTIDGDQNSLIDMHEFSERFQISFDRVRLANAAAARGEGKDQKQPDVAAAAPQRRRRRSSIEQDVWAQQQLLEIGRRMYTVSASLEEAFRQFDTDSSGGLSRDQFSQALEAIGMRFDAESAARLFGAVDADSSDSIKWDEFVRAFQIDDTGMQGVDSDRATWQDSVVQQVANSLFQHRTQLLSAFRMFDMDNNGTLSAEDFRVGLRAVNKLLPQDLSSVQIDELCTALDKDSNGIIDYKEFLEGLKVRACLCVLLGFCWVSVCLRVPCMHATHVETNKLIHTTDCGHASRGRKMNTREQRDREPQNDVKQWPPNYVDFVKYISRGVPVHRPESHGA